jgi:hypothetical protein
VTTLPIFPNDAYSVEINREIMRDWRPQALLDYAYECSVDGDDAHCSHCVAWALYVEREPKAQPRSLELMLLDAGIESHLIPTILGVVREWQTRV